MVGAGAHPLKRVEIEGLSGPGGRGAGRRVDTNWVRPGALAGQPEHSMGNVHMGDGEGEIGFFSSPGQPENPTGQPESRSQLPSG